MIDSPVNIRADARNILRAICIGLIVIPAASSCRGPSPDWNGTWRLVPAKCNIPGPGHIFKISKDPDGMYHSGSGGETANFRCDGKGYQQQNLMTAFCTQQNSSELEITDFKNGTKMITVQWKLSSDGKAMTARLTRFYGDGESTENRYVRTSGSTGFAGAWRSTSPLAGIASLWQITMGSNAVHYSFPDRAVHVDAFLDGTYTAFDGPMVSPKVSIAVREHGPRELDFAEKSNGRVFEVGKWQISLDGRSLTDSYWAPGRPNETCALVYQKQ